MDCLNMKDTSTKKPITGTSTSKNHGSTTAMRTRIPSKWSPKVNTLSSVSGKSVVWWLGGVILRYSAQFVVVVG